MLKKILNKKGRGFTLVELLIVVVILAILFLIVAVRVPKVLTRAREAKTKDHLANMRVAINNYYSTNPGFFPRDLDDKPDIVGGQQIPAFIPNYMPRIPRVRLRANLGHSSNSINVRVVDTGTGLITKEMIEEKHIGGWIYSSTTGEIRINCTHIDSREKMYYSNYGHEEE
jgi:prepilin-type N-terminal cleavage/methylation domain-containing protein